MRVGCALDYLAAIVLALVQGLTEFLPISSSAHLILVPQLLGWSDQGLAFDVAVHLGTLIAVIWIFQREIKAIVIASLNAVCGREHDRTEAQLGSAILVATLPVIVAGLMFEHVIASQLRSPMVIAVTTAVFGVLLWVADRRRNSVDDEHEITLWMALLIGLAQMLALVPGTSRSGVTIMAGLGLGLSRKTAARFSFLLSIPAIGGASVLETQQLIQSDAPVNWSVMLVGLLVAGVSAYVCIKLFLQTIERIGMLPFMLYRLLLAAVLFVIFF